MLAQCACWQLFNHEKYRTLIFASINAYTRHSEQMTVSKQSKQNENLLTLEEELSFINVTRVEVFSKFDFESVQP